MLRVGGWAPSLVVCILTSTAVGTDGLDDPPPAPVAESPTPASRTEPMARTVDTSAGNLDIDFYSKALLGLSSVIVALLVYLHSRTRQRDAWFQAYTTVYEEFWSDEEMREIRSWLANENAFAEAKRVFDLRRAVDDGSASAMTISKDEYLYIDKLDRFLSLMTRMVAVGSEFKRNRMWGIGLWEFWLEACYRRPELRWYVASYWKELGAYCRSRYRVPALPASA